MIRVALFYLVFTATAVADWVSPTGSTDPENRWSNESKAYDDNTSTYADDNSLRTGFGAYIYLTLPSAINCSRIRINADWWTTAVDYVEIDVFKDGAWANVHTGSILNCAWDEFTFTTGSVTQARFRYHYINGGYIFWLYEFDFYEEPLVINAPTGTTDPATKVEETTAIAHGTVAGDGGEPCEFRFEYGLTASYGSTTSWRSSRATGESFTQLITGLTNGELYHFRAQIRNSAGTTNCADESFSTGSPSSGWICPSGSNDPDTAWDDEADAYDDDMNTYTKSFHDINDPSGQWSSFLEMSHAGVLCNKLRYFARGVTGDANYVDLVDVDIKYDGDSLWTDVYQGAVADKAWEERTFTEGDVTDARIRFHVNNNGAGLFFELYEFNLWRVSSNAPTLAWTGEPNYVSDGVNPESGDQNTEFEFRVQYTDLDNDAPSLIQVYLDKNGDGDYDDPGEHINMILATDAASDQNDGNFTNGEIYKATTTIPYGEHSDNITHYFVASDGTNVATGVPTTVQNGPDVLTYLDFDYVPTTVEQRTYFTVTVRATDGSGALDPSKTYAVTLTKESGPGEVYGDSSWTQNLVGGEYTWNDIYIMDAGTYKLRITGSSYSAPSSDVTVTVKTEAAVLDDYDGVDDLTYTYDASETATWSSNTNFSGSAVLNVNSGNTAPEHSYASYDLSQTYGDWTIDSAKVITWTGWMFLDRNAVSGWNTNNWSVAMVLAADSPDFNNPGVSGYALGYQNSGDNLVLLKFTDGISDGQRNIPDGSTIVLTSGYVHDRADNGVNVYVERDAAGNWTVNYEPGFPFSAANAIEKANYTSASPTVNDVTYTGNLYKYSGWVFAHRNNNGVNAYFDNFGAFRYSDLDAPVAIAATGIGPSSFTANWNAVSGANDYRLEVSDQSNFSTFTDAYRNFLANGTSQLVSVPDQGTYYYRVRASNGVLVSDNSNTISVLVTQFIAVELKESDTVTDYTTWTISGVQDPSQDIIMDSSQCVYVKNTGNVNQDFSIFAVPANWTLGTVAGPDQCVLMGLFNGNSQPSSGDYNTTYDIITGTVQWSSTSAGNGDFEGTNSGFDVAPGFGEKFYIYLKIPSSVSSGDQESITVTIGCRAN